VNGRRVVYYIHNIYELWASSMIITQLGNTFSSISVTNMRQRLIVEWIWQYSSSGQNKIRKDGGDHNGCCVLLLNDFSVQFIHLDYFRLENWYETRWKRQKGVRKYICRWQRFKHNVIAAAHFNDFCAESIRRDHLRQETWNKRQ